MVRDLDAAMQRQLLHDIADMALDREGRDAEGFGDVHVLTWRALARVLSRLLETAATVASPVIQPETDIPVWFFGESGEKRAKDRKIAF